MRALVYWARAEKVRIRPTHKTEAEIQGTAILPDGRHVPFQYHRQKLTLSVGNVEAPQHPLEGKWQLNEFGVPVAR